MSLTNPVFALLLLAEATCVGWVLLRLFGLEQTGARVSTIDGLRGYLAVAVAVHHSAIWYHFAHTGRWEDTGSALYDQLGGVGVSLFFMVTGFLFSRKVILRPPGATDWYRIYASRILRLSPLYFFTIALVVLIVMARSDFRLKESPMALVGDLLPWIGFSFQRPSINLFAETPLITAVVTWTLTWEWKFYAVLPALAWAFTRSRNTRWLFWTGVVVMIWFIMQQRVGRLFISGFAAALLTQQPRFVEFSKSKWAAMLALATLLAATLLFADAYHFGPYVLLSVAFCIVANGNSLFGLLAAGPARMLGEISYSVYLLHGIALYTLFRFVLTQDQAASLSPVAHWALIAGLLPVLLVCCFITFRSIEAPAMHRTDALAGWMRRHMSTFLGSGLASGLGGGALHLRLGLGRLFDRGGRD